MSFGDLTTIAPIALAILTAAAVLIVDVIWPGRSSVAIGTALAGLGLSAIATIVI